MNGIFKEIIEDISRVNSLDTKTIPEKFMKFNEEFGEFATEAIKALGITHKPYDEKHLIEEAADALQVLLSIVLIICNEKEIDFQKVLESILIKNKKWELMLNKYIRNL